MQKKRDWLFLVWFWYIFSYFCFLIGQIILNSIKYNLKSAKNTNKNQINEDSILFEHRTPALFIITHEMPKLFRKCIFFSIFSYFCTHDIQGASQSAKIVTDSHSVTHKIEKQMWFFEAIFLIFKSRNFVNFKFLHFCLWKLQF